jgi:hypothetical protein
MKKLHIAPYCIALAVGNCFAPAVLAYIAGIMGWIYGREPACKILMAGCTPVALALPPWFYGFTGLSLLACLGLFVRKVSVPLLVHGLLAVLILEILVLIFFIFGICISLAPIIEKVGR